VKNSIEVTGHFGTFLLTSEHSVSFRKSRSITGKPPKAF